MNIKLRANADPGSDLNLAGAVRLAMGTNRDVTYIQVTPVDNAGNAIFGLDAEVTVRRNPAYGDATEAMVRIAGIATHATEAATARITAYTIATQVAATANAAAANQGAACLNDYPGLDDDVALLEASAYSGNPGFDRLAARIKAARAGQPADWTAYLICGGSNQP